MNVKKQIKLLVNLAKKINRKFDRKQKILRILK